MSNSKSKGSLSDIGYDNKIVSPPKIQNTGIIDNSDLTNLTDISEPKTENKIKNNFYNQYIWIFLVAAIVVIILCVFIVKSEVGWYSNLQKYSWAENLWVWMILFVATVLIMAISTYISFLKAQCLSDSSSMFYIFMSFIASMILLVIWFVIFFRSKDLETGFYLSMVILFVSFIQIYLVWKMNSGAGWGVVPWIVFLLFLIAAVWQMNVQNDECF